MNLLVFRLISLFNKYSFVANDLEVIDLTKTANIDIRKYKRKIENIVGVVLHQTSFNWKDNNPNWNEVNSHFAIMRSGKIFLIHDPIWRLSHSSENANENYIAIEHEGNFRSINNKCYAPEKFGCDDFPSLEQIQSSRKLIKVLKSNYPNFKNVTAHIQWQKEKSNCPGPHIWYNVGEWVKNNLELSDIGNKWHHPRGTFIPNEWRDPKYQIII